MYEFEPFEIFLKQTLNLLILTKSSNYDKVIIDASRWKHLLTTSLPYLDIFRFESRCFFMDEKGSLLLKFRRVY